ncbi:MAG: TauD/TfdA family dioxygenase [Rhodospirillaceae bacterium]
MTITVQKLTPLFGAQLFGINLRETTRENIGDFLELMDLHAVCAVPHDVPLSNEEHIGFAQLLGPMERSKNKISGTDKRVAYDEIVDQSNLGPTGDIYPEGDRRLAFKRANRLWHTDMSFYPVRATYSALSAHTIPPEGGNTEFIDMRAVYDDLTESMKSKLNELKAEHCYWHSRVLGGGPEPTPKEREARPPSVHPLVNHNERTGRKSLYLASHIRTIRGLPESEAESLLEELYSIATQSKYVLSYKWKVGDILIWDNLCTMHRATPFADQSYIRDMRRTTCRETYV